MSLVVMSSGGVDSTLVSVLATEAGQRVHPLFVDYGQRAAIREWAACVRVHGTLGLPRPKRVRLAGFRTIVHSGLTDRRMDVVEEAFTPGRNAMFLLLGAAHAFCVGARAVALGLLDERQSLFPDQRRTFLEKMEDAIEAALGARVSVVAPLMNLSKAEVMAIAAEKGITGTYSCHSGTARPCGKCISCLEVVGAKAAKKGGRNGRRIRRAR